uniref:Uncharacterized protein n=1 Tax=Solanum lycopersicum TaxID=4081 RepID=A0A3Q7HSM2_SOLLC
MINSCVLIPNRNTLSSTSATIATKGSMFSKMYFKSLSLNLTPLKSFVIHFTKETSLLIRLE